MEMRPRPLAPPAAAFTAPALLFPPARHHIPPLLSPFPRLPSGPIVLSSVHLSLASVSLLSPFAFSPGFRYFPSWPSIRCLSSVLHISFSLSSLAPFPCPSPLMSFSSPTPPCLAKSPRGNQQRQTKSSDFIILINFPLQFLQ